MWFVASIWDSPLKLEPEKGRKRTGKGSEKAWKGSEKDRKRPGKDWKRTRKDRKRVGKDRNRTRIGPEKDRPFSGPFPVLSGPFCMKFLWSRAYGVPEVSSRPPGSPVGSYIVRNRTKSYFRSGSGGSQRVRAHRNYWKHRKP